MSQTGFLYESKKTTKRGRNEPPKNTSERSILGKGTDLKS